MEMIVQKIQNAKVVYVKKNQVNVFVIMDNFIKKMQQNHVLNVSLLYSDLLII